MIKSFINFSILFLHRGWSQDHLLRNVETFFGVSLKCNPVLVLQSFDRVALLIWTARSTDVKVWSSSHLPTMLYLEYNIQKVDGLREGFTKRKWTARSTDVKVRSSSGKYLPMQSCIWNITKIKWSYVFPLGILKPSIFTHTHTSPMYNCWALWVVEFTSAIARKHFLIAFTPGRKHTATGKMGIKIGRNQFERTRRKTKNWPKKGEAIIQPKEKSISLSDYLIVKLSCCKRTLTSFLQNNL